MDTPIFYLKVNENSHVMHACLKKWIAVISCISGGKYYILCDKPEIEKYIIDNKHIYNPLGILHSDRTKYSDIVYGMFANKWLNAAFAHLSVLEHARTQDIKWFWNIDADDTTILLEPQNCAMLLNNVQNYAQNDYKDAYSLDMWRSRKYKGHWSFGVSYMKNNVDWLGIFERNYNKNNWKSINSDFNLDWFFTYLKDSKILELETFYFSNVYFKHFNDNILLWKNGNLYLSNSIRGFSAPNTNFYPIADDCLRFTPNITPEECYNETIRQFEIKL